MVWKRALKNFLLSENSSFIGIFRRRIASSGPYIPHFKAKGTHIDKRFIFMYNLNLTYIKEIVT